MSEATNNVTKEKLVDDIKVVLHDAGVLLREIPENLSEKTKEARDKLERGVKVAKERLADIQKQGVEQARKTAKATDEFVHEHPWQSVGIAFSLGALIGVLIGRR